MSLIPGPGAGVPIAPPCRIEGNHTDQPPKEEQSFEDKPFAHGMQCRFVDGSGGDGLGWADWVGQRPVGWSPLTFGGIETRTACLSASKGSRFKVQGSKLGIRLSGTFHYSWMSQWPMNNCFEKFKVKGG
jgi:hypothetical protein